MPLLLDAAFPAATARSDRAADFCSESRRQPERARRPHRQVWVTARDGKCWSLRELTNCATFVAIFSHAGCSIELPTGIQRSSNGRSTAALVRTKCPWVTSERSISNRFVERSQRQGLREPTVIPPSAADCLSPHLASNRRHLVRISRMRASSSKRRVRENPSLGLAAASRRVLRACAPESRAVVDKRKLEPGKRGLECSRHALRRACIRVALLVSGPTGVPRRI